MSKERAPLEIMNTVPQWIQTKQTKKFSYPAPYPVGRRKSKIRQARYVIKSR